MLALAISLAGLIGISVLVQLIATGSYVRWFNHYATSRSDDARLPPAAIILCLRGTDPFLADCLERLTTQDYPHYRVHVVIDHATDPARRVVEQWMQTHGERAITMEFLEEKSDEAYLKTSAIRQCVRALDASVGFAVMADADTLVYRQWLRDLVAPMIDSDIGIVTGNRWYDPTRKSWGSVVRFQYNACCVIPMLFMRATWGGSLAIRRDVFDQAYFFDRMQRTSSEDYAMQDAARKRGLRIEVHPNVMVLNREQCTLKSCFTFVRRQLIWTRLYHPNWNQIVIGVVAVYLVLAGAAVAAIVAAATGETRAAWLIGGALLAELMTVQFIIERLHRTVGRRSVVVQEQPFPSITGMARLRLVGAWPMTLFLLTAAVISATFSRRVKWRGITYEIVPPDGIRMLEYQPYTASATVPADRSLVS